MHRDPHGPRVPSGAASSESRVANHGRKGKGNINKKVVDKVQPRRYQDEKEESEKETSFGRVVMFCTYLTLSFANYLAFYR